MNLKNKKSLITGGSSGLGFSIAKKLLQRGMEVTICGRNLQSLKNAQKQLGDKLKVIQCDVSKYKEVQLMAKEVGYVDVLINNAGVVFGGDLEEYHYTKISEIIDTNLKGLIYVTRAFLPLMRVRNQGFIINVSSTSGTKARFKQSVYVASKWGVTGFTDSLKLDLENTNIRVVGFYPGGMNTNLFRKAGMNLDTTQWMDSDKVADIVCLILETDESMILDHVVLNKVIKKT